MDLAGFDVTFGDPVVWPVRYNHPGVPRGKFTMSLRDIVNLHICGSEPCFMDKHVSFSPGECIDA